MQLKTIVLRFFSDAQTHYCYPERKNIIVSRKTHFLSNKKKLKCDLKICFFYGKLNLSTFTKFT